jgi:hypothetical protein
VNDDEAMGTLGRLGLLVADRQVPLTEVLAGARRARARRRRVRVGSAVAGSALAVAVGAAALGSGPFTRADGPVATDPSSTPSATPTEHSAHTGEQPSDAEDIRLGGPGEELDPSGDDFAQVVLEVTTDIPFPSDQARAISAQFQYDDLHDEIDSRVSTGALRGFVANDAICSWANAWAYAVTSADVAGQKAAAQALQGASAWPAVTDLDKRLAGRSRFWFLPPAQQAALGVDVEAMGRALATHVMCLPALVPDLPQALPPGVDAS